MTGLKEYIDALHPLSETTWAQLRVLFSEKVLRKHDHFITEGNAETEIGFLKEGLIRAYYRNSEGIEYNKHFFTDPCFIGAYSSLISGKPNQINQQALSDCRILVANYSEFKALYPACPDLERAARILAEHFFVQKEQREIDLVVLDAGKRYELFQKEFPHLESQIPQYHLASYLGITPTQLSRIRRKLAGK